MVKRSEPREESTVEIATEKSSKALHFQRIPMPGFSTNNRSDFLPWCCIAIISCAVSIAGCGTSAESHEDEHHDEHLEHFVPAHKPKSFTDLVDQLALRAPKLNDASQPSDGEASQPTGLQEFSDIIGWIPELAADSELTKPDFESAVAAGNKLATVFAETLGPKKTKSFEAETIEPLIEELRTLVPKSQDQKERI